LRYLDRIGPEDTKMVRDAIAARIAELRDSGGHAKKDSGENE